MKKRRRPTRHHPLYGDIPLVERTYVGRDGLEHHWHDWDHDFQPELPPGAVRGDVRRQHFCHDVPKYFYVDEERTCRQCDRPFIFGAHEQKYWYETLQFNFASFAVRCLDCRRERRTEAFLRQQVAWTLDALRARPRNAPLLLELAKTTVDYRERTGAGDLDRAIAACRVAREEWPEAIESFFWEARCQQLAGRNARAATAFRAFIDAADGKGRWTRLLRIAEQQLAALGHAQKR